MSHRILDPSLLEIVYLGVVRWAKTLERLLVAVGGFVVVEELAGGADHLFIIA